MLMVVGRVEEAFMNAGAEEEEDLNFKQDV